MSNQDLYVVTLDQPLAGMSDMRNFSLLVGAPVNKYWPDSWSEKY